MSEACSLLHSLLNDLPRFHADFADEAIPSNGLYVMFQKGEAAHGTDRIVRIGTHTGKGQLRSRLHQHFHKPIKDRSIFRKHVGRALLTRADDPFIEQWNWDLTTREAKDKYTTRLDHARQEEVEKEVTAFMAESISFGAMTIDSKEERKSVEEALLSTLASCSECCASKDWLGLHHPDARIRQAGLWNIQGVNGVPLTAQEVRSIIEGYAIGDR